MNADEVLTAGPEDAAKRLDQFVKGRLDPFSRSQIQRWIRERRILLNGSPALPADAVRAGDEISVAVPEAETTILPEDIPLEILHEDDKILVVNKPAGWVTHPASGHLRGTLANAVAFHFQNQPKARRARGELERLGIVHRLDKETSGVMVVAKTQTARDALALQFESREVKKVYRAIVWGRMEADRGEIEGSIGKKIGSARMEVTASGRKARTDFKVLERTPRHTYLEAYPRTGRTHQIRVHLAKLGHAVLGDKIYSFSENLGCKRQMLHAWKLAFVHPKTGKEVSFCAPLPADFRDALSRVKKLP